MSIDSSIDIMRDDGSLIYYLHVLIDKKIITPKHAEEISKRASRAIRTTRVVDETTKTPGGSGYKLSDGE